MDEKMTFRQILRHTLGIAMFTFVPGTGVGAGVELFTNPAEANYALAAVQGGMTAALSAYTTVIIFLGVQLAWNGKLTYGDWIMGFRQAAAKAADGNEEVTNALKVSEKGSFDFADFGDVDDLES